MVIRRGGSGVGARRGKQSVSSRALFADVLLRFVPVGGESGASLCNRR